VDVATVRCLFHVVLFDAVPHESHSFVFVRGRLFLFFLTVVPSPAFETLLQLLPSRAGR
jgi:hypothetical protein